MHTILYPREQIETRKHELEMLGDAELADLMEEIRQMSGDQVGAELVSGQECSHLDGFIIRQIQLARRMRAQDDDEVSHLERAYEGYFVTF